LFFFFCLLGSPLTLYPAPALINAKTSESRPHGGYTFKRQKRLEQDFVGAVKYVVYMINRHVQKAVAGTAFSRVPSTLNQLRERVSGFEGVKANYEKHKEDISGLRIEVTKVFDNLADWLNFFRGVEYCERGVLHQVCTKFYFF
jgi:hypothetical protein